ncbi:hypothetical protein ACV2G6_22450, partial [Salmonella enterica subsp. enterica serovar Dublin]
MAMNVELTAEQKIALEALQRKSRDPINEQNRCTTGPELNGHCCKVSDEAAFCLIQRPYISKTLLT